MTVRWCAISGRRGAAMGIGHGEGGRELPLGIGGKQEHN